MQAAWWLPRMCPRRCTRVLWHILLGLETKKSSVRFVMGVDCAIPHYVKQSHQTESEEETVYVALSICI